MDFQKWLCYHDLQETVFRFCFLLIFWLEMLVEMHPMYIKMILGIARWFIMVVDRSRTTYQSAGVDFVNFHFHIFFGNFWLEMVVKTHPQPVKTTKNDWEGPRMVYNGRGVPQDHLPSSGSWFCEIRFLAILASISDRTAGPPEPLAGVPGHPMSYPW